LPTKTKVSPACRSTARVAVSRHFKRAAESSSKKNLDWRAPRFRATLLARKQSKKPPAWHQEGRSGRAAAYVGGGHSEPPLFPGPLQNAPAPRFTERADAPRVRVLAFYPLSAKGL
jgi:hypothetical protein